MKRFEEKNLQKANNAYRNFKRAEKAISGGDKGGSSAMGNIISKGSPLQSTTGKYMAAA